MAEVPCLLLHWWVPYWKELLCDSLTHCDYLLAPFPDEAQGYATVTQTAGGRQARSCPPAAGELLMMWHWHSLSASRRAVR